MRWMHEILKEGKYRIIKSQNEEGFNIASEEDKTRLLVARNGDNLKISFQCKLCPFRNLKKLTLGGGEEIYCY